MARKTRTSYYVVTDGVSYFCRGAARFVRDEVVAQRFTTRQSATRAMKANRELMGTCLHVEYRNGIEDRSGTRLVALSRADVLSLERSRR